MAGAHIDTRYIQTGKQQFSHFTKYHETFICIFKKDII